MARLLSLFSALKRRVHQFLFEDSDHPYAPFHRKRPVLHNALVTQGWIALIGIFAILLAPIMLWCLSVPYFVISYVGFAFMGFTVTCVLRVKHWLTRHTRESMEGALD
jgi:uncharacterized membrane protein YdbT with pleckstrin-like domain